MTSANKGLQQSALVMKILGWGIIVGLAGGLFLYPPGFLWGSHPASFPNIGPPHPESPYNALHPYLFMIYVLYLAYGTLMIRGAKDPKANAALFDYGILANVLHGLVMFVQAFIYPNEHAHLWADVPVAFAVPVILWIYHPNRVAPETSRV
jgi:Family of unknown function (DUF6632)